MSQPINADESMQPNPRLALGSKGHRKASLELLTRDKTPSSIEVHNM